MPFRQTFVDTSRNAGADGLTFRQEVSTILTEWSNFYVITGSAAAALTGLVFVVITIVAGSRFGATREGISTFTTPTVVHFCVALFVSALLSAPWHSLKAAGAIVTLSGLYGISYVFTVARRTRRQTSYKPGVDDWLRYVVVPFAAYATLGASGMCIIFALGPALFACAGSVLLLIFIGIHNAWDIVTYIAVQSQPPDVDARANSSRAANTATAASEATGLDGRITE